MMKKYTDMIGKEVCLSAKPVRIISVVPSQTELLYDLGLDEEVVGITKFCVHPDAWFRSKKRVGGTKQLNIEKILSLQPDLILANKEENTREQIERLATMVPVWTSDIQTVPQALEMIRSVGKLTGTAVVAEELAARIAYSFSLLKKPAMAMKVAYFIWYRPWMAAGGDTFINDMIERAGWLNVLKHEQRYPEVHLEKLREQKPDYVFLSSEPFPFRERHIEEIKAVLPEAEVKLVDGELFSWYGSRMLKAASYLEAIVAGNI